MGLVVRWWNLIVPFLFLSFDFVFFHESWMTAFEWLNHVFGSGSIWQKMWHLNISNSNQYFSRILIMRACGKVICKLLSMKVTILELWSSQRYLAIRLMCVSIQTEVKRCLHYNRIRTKVTKMKFFSILFIVFIGTGKYLSIMRRHREYLANFLIGYQICNWAATSGKEIPFWLIFVLIHLFSS